MYRLTGIPVSLDTPLKNPTSLAARALGVSETHIGMSRIVKKSVDARNKSDVHFVVSIDFSCDLNEKRLRVSNPMKLQTVEDTPWATPTGAALSHRPVVVGLGPAGLFAALLLAQAGLSPVVIERGRSVEDRTRDVEQFFQDGTLNENSNVQFGEGGAGAFSDGKLNTGISDPRCRYVLETLHRHGAPETVLYEAKPHVGTDKLPGVVKSIRQSIVSLGGEVLFETALSKLITENGCIRGIETSTGLSIETDCVILAVGHSARDTFEHLNALGVPMQAKPFSVGARIEHHQKMIDVSQYGAFAGHQALGAAEYKLSVHGKDGRGIYTFCMCPGGTVVAAASERGHVVTNGMSAYARDGENANAALLVSVNPADYGADHPLSGIQFQRTWEKSAFALGGGAYRAPVQRVEDFLKDRASHAAGEVKPTYKPGVTYANLADCLPEFVIHSMREGLTLMDRRLKGFAHPDALLTGVETRSSSPLRILRSPSCMSEISGLYPCGEGAGYAGGIMSAAVDGLRCAQAMIENNRQDKL